MLSIGQTAVRTGQGLERRALLRAGALSALGLTLPDLMRVGAAEPTSPKSIILLWLWGGPSHLESFDPKPQAPTEYRGPFAPIATSAPGVDICELLPRLARRAHLYSLIRSLHCSSNDHGIAGTIGLTGNAAGGASLGGQVLPGTLHPNHGSIVSRVYGFSPVMPRFLSLGGRLHQGKQAIRGEGASSLGAIHDPFRLDYHPDQGLQIPDLQLTDGVSASGLAARERLLQSVNTLARQLDRSAGTHRLDQYYEQAFGLLTRPGARDVFDVTREPDTLRRTYGQFRFGQCCLLARRLVDAGARFVQVNWSSHVESMEDTGDGGWDMHDRYFPVFQERHAWMLDQALSALLDDLQSRRRLNETLVIAVGEFGRTPKINNKAGRDHWEHCYSALVAGGGLATGRVVGASDRLAEYPVSRPVTPADLFATALTQIGISTTTLTTNGLLPQGNLIEELV